MKQLSNVVQNGIMQLQRLNNLKLGTNDGGLFNVSPSMGLQNISNMTNMAAMGPTGAPAGILVGTAGATLDTVGCRLGLTTTKVESNLFAKSAAQTFLQPKNEANNNNNNGKHKLNNGGIIGKNKLSIDTNQSFGQLIAASSAMMGTFNSGAPPLPSLPIISPNGISDGVNSINTINTKTTTNASSLLLSQSSTNGNLNNSYNFPSALSPPLSPTFGGPLTAPLGLSLVDHYNTYNIWFILKELIERYESKCHSSIEGVLNRYGGGVELNSIFTKIIILQQRVFQWKHGSMTYSNKSNTW